MVTLSIAGTHRSKRHSKTPYRRRATFDSSSLAARPIQFMERRPSLPLKKSVQFSELSELCVFELPSADALKWYSGQDHQQFKRERRSDVASVRERSRRNTLDGSSADFCFVGIEQLLSPRSMARAYSVRKEVIRSVLVEQDRQRTSGYRDPDLIASLSIRLSADAFEGARKRGKFQEMAMFVE